MKSLIIVVVILSGFLAIQGYAKMIEVTVRQFHGRDYRMFGYGVDDEKTTVRELANMYLKDCSLPTDPKSLGMENRLGIPYSLDKTLKDAGVKDKATIRLRNESKIIDSIDKVISNVIPF